jgi:hypothetical protein
VNLGFATYPLLVGRAKLRSMDFRGKKPSSYLFDSKAENIVVEYFESEQADLACHRPAFDQGSAISGECEKVVLSTPWD